MIAVSKVWHHSLGTSSFTSPATVCNDRSVRYLAGPGCARNAMHRRAVHLGIQQCVERLLDRSTHHRAEMNTDAGSVVNLDAYRL